MDYAWMIYWITRLDSIKCLFAVSAGLLIAALFVVWMYVLMEGRYSAAKPFRIWGAVVAFVLLYINVFIPSKQDALMIAASVGVIEAAKGISQSSIVGKSAELLEMWIDKELEKQKEKK